MESIFTLAGYLYVLNDFRFELSTFNESSLRLLILAQF